MARPKHGPSLFEVLRTEEPSREVSRPARRMPWQVLREWFADGREAPADSSTPPRLAVVPPNAERESRDAESQPWLAVRGRHLAITLTSRQAAIAVFSFVVLLFVIFAAGDRLGQGDFHRGVAAGRAALKPSIDEIEQLQNRPPTPGLVDGLLVGSPNPGSTRETPAGRPQPGNSGVGTGNGAGTWTRGLSYVVAQEFAADRREDATKAQAFLLAQGIATEIVLLPAGQFQLITTQGYNAKEPPQKRAADDLLKRIHDLGAQYYAAGGGYKLQGYFKTLKGDRW